MDKFLLFSVRELRCHDPSLIVTFLSSRAELGQRCEPKPIGQKSNNKWGSREEEALSTLVAG